MGVPALQNIYNEKYTIEEFMELTEDIHAELIDGCIYNMAPPKRFHQEIVGELYSEIRNYIKRNKGGCKVYPAPFGVKLSDDTLVEPDISVICDKSKLTENGCDGAPDWIIEVTSSNSANDYSRKLRLYMENDVREYWIVDPDLQIVTIHHFKDKKSICEIHSFTDTLQAGIYQDNAEQLEICISSLIES